MSGSAFCTVKSVPFYIDAEDLVEVRFGDLSQRGTSKDSEHRIAELAGVKESRFSLLKHPPFSATTAITARRHWLATLKGDAAVVLQGFRAGYFFNTSNSFCAPGGGASLPLRISLG